MTKLGHLKSLAVALFGMLGVAAQAQKLPTATAPGAYLAVGGTYGAFQAEYPQRLLGGAGVYADLNIRRHFGIEAEIRWLRQNQLYGSNQTTYLIGPRFELHRGRLLPYIKGFVGDGKLVFPYFGPAYYGNFLVIGGGGGLDVSISQKLKIRAFDFEYQNWPQFNFGAGLSQGAITPYGVSAGLSYQVYHTGGWPKHRYK